MTSGYAGFGTLLKIGDGGGPETFTTIAEVTDLSGPELGTETIDMTNHSSANATKEKIAGLKEIGPLSFAVNWIPSHATHSYSAGLVKDWYNRTIRNFQVLWPNGTTWQGPALVTKVGPSAPIDDKLAADVELTPTGAWTLA